MADLYLRSETDKSVIVESDLRLRSQEDKTSIQVPIEVNVDSLSGGFFEMNGGFS